MARIPRLYTPRLCLRPLMPADAPRVRHLAGDERVAMYTARIPHPYPEGAAESWIASQESGEAYNFAITLTGTRTPGRESFPGDTGYLIGVVGLTPCEDESQRQAELGYWIGVPFWNKGFATEAARAVLDFAFHRLRLHRVTSGHFAENPASGRVLRKLGLVQEGTLRSHFAKNGEFHDLVVYGVLSTEWARQRKRLRPDLAARELAVA